MNKLEYNSPVILSYGLLSAIVMLLTHVTHSNINVVFFACSPNSPTGFIDVITMFTHIIGHSNWAHLGANFTLILLIGPIVEEKYGSANLFLMILLCAFATSLINMILFSNGILGASGIVFMLMILASFTNNSKGIPLTFVLVSIIFIGNEIGAIFQNDNVSQFAHIMGGMWGGVFGFIFRKGDQSYE